ncbi:hypothetical protein CMT52_16900 [Elizabethkingia anophelis]|nr:hypothetical protein [Elizabethkingia anophelis]MDV4026012.1 hypothetical protein [Elizabethkingia anophelis]
MNNMNIDNTVEFYFSLFKKRGIFNLFGGLEKDLESQFLDLKSNKFSDLMSPIQEFVLDIKTGISTDSYKVSWSISKAENIINRYSIKNKIVNVRDLYINYDKVSIDKNKLSDFKGTESEKFPPIIISFYRPLGEYIVIDGNHRLYEVLQRREKSVRAFVLSPFSNAFIMNEKSYKLYCFHHNLLVLSRYCKSPISFFIKNNRTLKANTYNGSYSYFSASLLDKFKILIS